MNLDIGPDQAKAPPTTTAPSGTGPAFSTAEIVARQQQPLKKLQPAALDSISICSTNSCSHKSPLNQEHDHEHDQEQEPESARDGQQQGHLTESAKNKQGSSIPSGVVNLQTRSAQLHNQAMASPTLPLTKTPPKTAATSPSSFSEELSQPVSNTQTIIPAKLPTPPPQPQVQSQQSTGATPTQGSKSLPKQQQQQQQPPDGSTIPSADVETNPDYIALTSALSLLLTQRSVACNDLIQLKKLKTEALDDPEKFLAGLRRTGKLPNVPKMQRIVRAPMVSWKTYGMENVHLDHQLARGLVDRQPSLTPVRLFDDQN